MKACFMWFIGHAFYFYSSKFYRFFISIFVVIVLMIREDVGQTQSDFSSFYGLVMIAVIGFLR